MPLNDSPQNTVRFEEVRVTEWVIGQRKSNFETPCLCLDLDAFESNVTRAAAVISASGKAWRPHAKCHKSPEIAAKLISTGALGITCAKVSEAEIFAQAGIRDILIAHLPVGQQRVQRLATLCRIASPIITCDHYLQAQSLSVACEQAGTTCRVLVEINVGMNRTGVRPGRDLRELAIAVDRLPGLKLAGIMGYEGHVMSIDAPDKRRHAIDAAMGILTEARDWYRQAGLCCDVVSAGGTGSLRRNIKCEALTEVQAGGLIFGDPYYQQMPDADDYQPVLTVLSTVVSRPSFDRAVLDAGRKAITGEKVPPRVKDPDDALVIGHNAEHIVLELGPEARELKIGDQVELIVGYSDLTTMLHNEYLCFRGDRLQSVWPIAARGKLV